MCDKIPSVWEAFPLSTIDALEKKCPIWAKNEPALTIYVASAG
jgi:hypothetical protein